MRLTLSPAGQPPHMCVRVWAVWHKVNLPPAEQPRHMYKILGHLALHLAGCDMSLKFPESPPKKAVAHAWVTRTCGLFVAGKGVCVWAVCHKVDLSPGGQPRRMCVCVWAVWHMQQ